MTIIAATMLTANAQQTFPAQKQVREHEHDGRVFIGGAVTFWNNTDEKKVSLDLCPEVGYLFNDDWGVGVMLGYEFESETEHAVKHVSQAFKISPFARYYYLHKGPFNLYLDGGFGWNREKHGVKDGNSYLHKGFEIGVRPGACVDLTEGLCLCLRMGFVGYRHDYFMGEEDGIGNNGFGVRFAPEELMIGLELEF